MSYKFYDILPSNPQGGDVIVKVTTFMKYTLVIGYNHDYAVYEGPRNWTSERVANDGDKISEMHAKELFPELATIDRYYRW